MRAVLIKNRMGLLTPLLCLSFKAWAADWSYQVESNTRAEYFNNNDDTAIYREEGAQSYLDLRFNGEARFSPFSTLTASALLYGNDSAYRDAETGLVLGNANVQWENGETSLPFRLQVGDFLGQYSLRTLQRSLKGVQAELQPGEKHSILFSSGVYGQRYDDLDADGDWYSGVSWTYSPWIATTFGLNWVNNRRQQPGTVTADEQNVASAFVDSIFLLLRQQVKLEMEFARADPVAGNSPINNGSNNDEKQDGVFAQFSGRGKHIDYRLRFENNDQFFAPRGGSATADRRNQELHLGYQFPARIRVNLRGQRLDSNRSSNALHSEVIGLRLGLPFGATAIDAFVQTQQDAMGTVDSELRSISVNMGSRLPGNWAWSGALSAQETSDDVSLQDSESSQINLALTRRFSWAQSGSGSFDIGMLLRNREQFSGDFDEAGPSIGWTMQNHRHQWQLRYALLNQDADGMATIGNFTKTASLRYSYSDGPHELTIEAEYQSRKPDNTELFSGNRSSLNYRYQFGNGNRRPSASSGSAATIRRLGLAGMSLGQPIAQLNDYGAAVQTGEWVRYDNQILPGISADQVLVVRTVDNIIVEAALLIDIGTAEVETLLAETLRDLSQRYGQPDLSIEQGEFDANWQAHIASGDLLRLYEWAGANGALRLGLPLTNTGVTHIEVRLAPRLPHPRDHYWGVDVAVP